MKEYKTKKLDEKEVRNAIAEKYRVPVEQVSRHGFTYCIETEIKEEEENGKDS